MKLYTEEQTREAIKLADKLCFLLDFEEEGIMSLLKPIKLPTDEEIGQQFKNYSENWEIRQALEVGAQWMRDKILNK